jgi:hypothetical protein
MLEVKRRYHALVFMLLLALTGVLMEPLEGLDWKVFNVLNTQRASWPQNFEVLDVAWDNDPATTEAFRHDIARALRTLAALPTPPEAVVLDVSISSLPLGLDELGAALDELIARQTQVFAAVALYKSIDGELDPDFMRFHARRQIYDRLSGKYGHTELNVKGRAVWFLPCLPLDAARPRAGGSCVPALAVSVAESLGRRNYDRSPEQRPVVVDMGTGEDLAEHRWMLQRDSGAIVRHGTPTGGSAQVGNALAHKLVIIGNLEYDRVGLLGDRAGTEVLGWTLADQIAPAGAARLKMLTHPAWLLSLTAIFTVLALSTFSTLRRRVAALRLNLVAVWAVSLVLVLALLALVVVGLRVALGAVYPQVTFVALAVLYAVSLTAHRVRMDLRERAMQEDVSTGTQAAPTDAYDVFLSYSRTPKENAAWVVENLYGSLSKQVVDGRPLRVFFDQTSIRVGTAWYFRLAESIQGSRCFVAVYSDEYFQKDFCKFEMGKAAVRLIKDRHFAVVPIVRGEVRVPAAFEHIQSIAATTPAEMVAQIVAALPAKPAASG